MKILRCIHEGRKHVLYIPMWGRTHQPQMTRAWGEAAILSIVWGKTSVEWEWGAGVIRCPLPHHPRIAWLSNNTGDLDLKPRSNIMYTQYYPALFLNRHFHFFIPHYHPFHEIRYLNAIFKDIEQFLLTS